MSKRKSASKKAGNCNEPAESGKKDVVSSNYTGYFYNQINRLWDEVVVLQNEVNTLRNGNGGR